MSSCYAPSSTVGAPALRAGYRIEKKSSRNACRKAARPIGEFPMLERRMRARHNDLFPRIREAHQIPPHSIIPHTVPTSCQRRMHRGDPITQAPTLHRLTMCSGLDCRAADMHVAGPLRQMECSLDVQPSQMEQFSFPSVESVDVYCPLKTS